MNLDNERKAFIEEMQKNRCFLNICKIKGFHVDEMFALRADGNFKFSDARIAWLAWLASANRESYKLVPVETLEESLSWASIAKWDSPSKERDLEIEKHEKIIEAMIGACDDH